VILHLEQRIPAGFSQTEQRIPDTGEETDIFDKSINIKYIMDIYIMKYFNFFHIYQIIISYNIIILSNYLKFFVILFI
jgi:hypothetical protein